MRDASGIPVPLGTRLLRCLPWVAIVAGIVLLASGFGNRLGLWDYRAAFGILRYASYVEFAVIAVAAVALLAPRIRARAATALVVALAAVALPLSILARTRGLPSINDITTDTADPPAFAAIVPMRAGATVPSTYAGEATAKAQQAGYPDIAPIVLADEPRVAFARALDAAQKLGWAVVASDAAAGRIEATATTPWFGFKDDVVIRVAADARGSRVDIRSVSRVGRGDLGVNAARVRAFTAAVKG